VIIVPIAAGWVGRDAILMAGVNAIIYMLSTLPTLVFATPQPIDQLTCVTQVVPRRPLGPTLHSHVWGCCGMFHSASPSRSNWWRSRWPLLWAQQVGSCTLTSLRLQRPWWHVSSYTMRSLVIGMSVTNRCEHTHSTSVQLGPDSVVVSP